MTKLVSLFGAVALIIASVGQASATSIAEEITVFYGNIGGGSFTIADLSFASPTSGNLFTGQATTSIGQTVTGSGTLFTEAFSLDTSQLYTFSFGGTFKGAVNDVSPSSVSQEFGAFSGHGATFRFVGADVSPVPLPASLPLFGLALISLVALGYHSRRKRTQTCEPDNQWDFAVRRQ